MDEVRGEKPLEKHSKDYADWQRRYESGEEHPRELFQQVSRIAQYMSYDLIDKLQYWEKETLKLSDEEVAERVKHVSRCLKQLQSAYVQFAETDF